MPDEENTQPAPEPTIPTENPISETNPVPVSPAEPIPDAPIPPIDSVPLEVPPEATEAPASPEDPSAVKDQNTAPPSLEATAGQGNEPLTPAPEPLESPNITVEKHGNDVTITEVMEPKSEPETATAQMAGNEPLPTTESSDEAKKKLRRENLKLANEKRQSKKREKINEILNLFSENQKITNDEVEKLLHVSDATATRYLETLEKEGKIRQVGKSGKYTHYEKI